MGNVQAIKNKFEKLEIDGKFKNNSEAAATKHRKVNICDGCRIVQTTKGLVVGRRILLNWSAETNAQHRAVDMYLGIPYAKPPTRPELRFKVTFKYLITS